MLPTRYSCVNSTPSASWIDTLDAPKMRAVVSAICCNGPATSPEELATACRISALACRCRRAVSSCLLRDAISEAAASFGFRAGDSTDLDFAGLDVARLALRESDLRACGRLRPVPMARCPAFPIVFAIHRPQG